MHRVGAGFSGTGLGRKSDGRAVANAAAADRSSQRLSVTVVSQRAVTSGMSPVCGSILRDRKGTPSVGDGRPASGLGSSYRDPQIILAGSRPCPYGPSPLAIKNREPVKEGATVPPVPL